MPASRGRVDSGETPWLVEIRGVSAVDIPCLRISDQLAVQGAVNLVIAEPVPELFPGLQQDVMGDLNAVLPENEQPLSAEDVDDHVNVSGHRYPWRAQFGPAAPAPLELAIQDDGGQVSEQQARRVLLLAGEGVVGGLGAPG